jgi:hypothetical protein
MLISCRLAGMQKMEMMKRWFYPGEHIHLGTLLDNNNTKDFKK